MVEKVEIRAQQGPQETFLSSPADIAIYGGAAGGGKSWALLIEPLRHIENPQFGGVVFRRTYPEIMNEGGLWDEAMKIYPLFGAQPRIGDVAFRFGSGSTISFSHLQYDQDRYRWQGAQICYLAFDELTHFSENVFFYMLSRNRSTSGIRPYVRATCNPVPDDDPTGGWVARFVSWWIDQDTGFAIPERSGRVRWFVQTDEGLVWKDSLEEAEREYPGQHPLSVTFIPASVYDNKILLRVDPGYEGRLKALPYVDRMQLLHGNWKIRVGAGKVFHRDWFEVVLSAPLPEKRPHTNGNGRHEDEIRATRWPLSVDTPSPVETIEECRFFDFAATARGTQNNDPDWTAGVKIRRAGGLYYVVDCQAGQWGPAELNRKFKQILESDIAYAKEHGIVYKCRWEIEPGSAGIRENQRMVAELAGVDAKGVRPGTGDKITRAKPFAVQCETGNVKVVRGRWTDQWLNHMHHQPDAPHDDIMDASVGAFDELTIRVPRKAISRQG